MIKEKLTMGNIMYDLKAMLKVCYVRLVWFLILFFVFLGLFLWCFSLGRIFIIHQVIFGFCVLMFSLLAIIQTVDIVKFYSILKNKNCIVKDKLIGMEIKEHFNNSRMYKTHHLYFSGYGEYIVTDDNYKWSTNFSMDEIGLYNYSACGDEFYLVLSKQYTGKIILAYSCKLFEFQE